MTFQNTGSETYYQLRILIADCLLLYHLLKNYGLGIRVSCLRFRIRTDPVLEEDVMEVFRQPRDSRDVIFALHVSLCRDALVESPRLVPDGPEVTEASQHTCARNQFWMFTRSTSPTARAGVLSKGSP